MAIEALTREDLKLVNCLCSRAYTGNRLLSNATSRESIRLKEIKKKLKNIAKYFSDKYTSTYGPFEVSVSSGNPVGRGKTLNNVWSGIFKGASHKQYAAQISFVINRDEEALSVGFYFGRASARSLSVNERAKLENQLHNLGVDLSNSILGNALLNEKYNDLFDFGFKTYSNGHFLSPTDWCNIIRTNPESSQIIAKIKPNEFDIIENSTIDSFVSQIIFLMSAISSIYGPKRPVSIKPLTPEQRAKQAERFAEIGQKGELYVMKCEQEKLRGLNIGKNTYPIHVALETMNKGYDILSVDENGDEIFIEVKTTTRTEDDPYSKRFFISNNEINVFLDNEGKYKLYRVYDIENKPSKEELNLSKLKRRPDGFIVEY